MTKALSKEGKKEMNWNYQEKQEKILGNFLKKGKAGRSRWQTAKQAFERFIVEKDLL